MIVEKGELCIPNLDYCSGSFKRILTEDSQLLRFRDALFSGNITSNSGKISLHLSSKILDHDLCWIYKYIHKKFLKNHSLRFKWHGGSRSYLIRSPFKNHETLDNTRKKEKHLNVTLHWYVVEGNTLNRIPMKGNIEMFFF